MQVDIFERSLEKSPTLEQLFSKSPIFNEESQRLIESVDHATLNPSTHALHDRNGFRISSSLLWRNRNLLFDVWPQNSTQFLETRRVAEEINDPAIFLGPINPHYGHFLTEFISRLWAVTDVRDASLKYVYSRAPIDGSTRYEQDFFDAISKELGLERESFLFISRPTRFSTVLIPHQTFFLRFEAYANHVHIPQKVANFLLRNHTTQISEQPAYLSRTKFSPRPNTRHAILNEANLEARLRQSGFAIYHPETMTLSEQVRMFNSHRWIVGLRGSAFHTALFSLLGREQHFCVIHEDDDLMGLSNYILIDRLANVNGYYIQGLYTVPYDNGYSDIKMETKTWRIDVEYVIQWLRNKGVISIAP